nr:transposase, MuDR, MULE transposase domain protein [Tanacetum cinerariifolium]
MEVLHRLDQLSENIRMDWKKLDNESFPMESIRFKHSSHVVVGRLIFWAGHERDGLTVPMCLSSLGNSLVLSGSMDETDCYLIVVKVAGILATCTLGDRATSRCGYQWLNVSYKRAWKGKQLALKSNQGDSISSFAQLPYYCYNLKLANENTVTHIDTDHEGHFKMLFIAFGAAVRI